MNQLTIDQLKRLVYLAPKTKVTVPAECGEINGHYYAFLYLLAMNVQPDLIVELGTGREARSAVHFALGAPKAKVIGIDIELPTFVPYPNIEWIQGDTWLSVKKVEALHIPLDILFIDSEHLTRQALGEYLLYSPLVRKGGIVLFDDIRVGGMEGLWSQIAEPKFTCDDLHQPQGFGVKIKE